MCINSRRQWSKRTRLKAFTYIGPYRYFMTVSCFDRQAIFKKADVVEMTFSVLREYSDKASFKLLAFCFMPDHLHFLAEGMDENAELAPYVARFKQVSGYRYKREFGQKLWQASYYEHVLRDEETSEVVAEYILDNPVRAGLVENYAKYLYSGSIWHKPFSGLKPLSYEDKHLS